jgi:hypothetical protein
LFDGAGDDFVLSLAALAADPDNTAQCQTGSAFMLTFVFSTADGGGYSPFFQDDEVAVADNGVPGHDGQAGAGGACDGPLSTDGEDGQGFGCDGIQNCVFSCPLCFDTEPTDLAVQVDRDGVASNIACVLP